MGTFVHPTAILDPTAELGENVRIGPYALIDAEVVIGDGTEVGAAAHVAGPTVVGKENRIYPKACVGFDPQDLKFSGERTELVMGDRNAVREFVTINRGTGKGGGTTRVGDDNLFLTHAHVAHDTVVGNRTLFVNGATLAGHVEVEDDAVIGAYSSVQQFCRVGRHAYIGGYSVITRDALPFVKTVGVKPSCYGVNRIGMERKGGTSEEIAQVETAYRLLTRGGLNTSQALDKIRAELGVAGAVGQLVEFIEKSQRGVIRNLPGRRASRGASE